MKNFINYILLQCETESAKCVAYFSARSRDRQIINLIRCDYTLILYVVGALIHLLPPFPLPTAFSLSVPGTLPLSLAASCNKNSCCCRCCYCGCCCCCWWQRATAAKLPLSDARAAAHQMQRADAAANDVAAAARITMPASKSQCCCLAPTLPANSWQGTNTHTHIQSDKHEASHDELCRCRCCCSRDANQ